MGKTVNPTDVTGWTQSINGSVWTPQRPAAGMNAKILQLENELQRQQRRGARTVDKTSGSAVITPAGIPKQVLSCQATESPVSQVDRVYSEIAVSFTRDPTDKNFAGVHIWVTGYHGNSQPVAVADAADSPAVFLLETTNEVVTVTVQPFNSGHVAAPFAGAKTTKALLNGQTTAPAAPSIATQTATITSGAVTVGQQFAFNYLPASLTDVMDGYWIYRTSVHSTPGIGARFKFVKASVQNSGVYTLVDSSGVSTNFYYVSSINKQGLESALTDATPGGGGGSIVTVYRPTSATNVSQPGGVFNPANAYDGSSATFAQISAANGVTPVEEYWSGFAANANAGTTTLVQLKMTSKVPAQQGTATAILRYSLNGGVSYTNVFSTTSTRAQKTDVVTLGNAQDLTQIRVDADNTQGTGAVTTYLYEAWVEVTHT